MRSPEFVCGGVIYARERFFYRARPVTNRYGQCRSRIVVLFVPGLRPISVISGRRCLPGPAFSSKMNGEFVRHRGRSGRRAFYPEDLRTSEREWRGVSTTNTPKRVLLTVRYVDNLYKRARARFPTGVSV